MLGWATVTEHPHRAEQKPAASSEPFLKHGIGQSSEKHQETKRLLQVSLRQLEFYMEMNISSLF